MQHVGQQQRERLVADDLARAPHRVAEAERRLLAGEARLAGARQLSAPARSSSFVLPRSASVRSSSYCDVEMVLDHALVAAGDEDEMLDPGLARLVDHVLDRPGGRRRSASPSGTALVAGRKRVPRPATGKTALRMRFIVLWGSAMTGGGGRAEARRMLTAESLGRLRPLSLRP